MPQIAARFGKEIGVVDHRLQFRPGTSANAFLVELSLQGEVLRKMPLNGWNNPEGVTVMENGLMAAGVSASNAVLKAWQAKGGRVVALRVPGGALFSR